MWLATMSLLAGLVPSSFASADGEQLSPARVSEYQPVEAASGATAAMDRPTTHGKRAFDQRSKLYQDRRPPPHPELPPPVRAGYDTVQVRESYQQCVRQAARQEPARISRAGLEAVLSTRCSNQKAALRTAILRREGTSPAAERVAAEELREATDSAIASARRTPR